jgi:hypothetical protein
MRKNQREAWERTVGTSDREEDCSTTNQAFVDDVSASAASATSPAQPRNTTAAEKIKGVDGFDNDIRIIAYAAEWVGASL